MLSDQYSSVFTQPRSQCLVEDVNDFFNCGETEWRQQHSGRPTLHDFRFTVNDIEMECKELKASCSPGPDGVPAALLKTASKELSKPLFLLWRASMDQGVIPDDLLLISPVHKVACCTLRRNWSSTRRTALVQGKKILPDSAAHILGHYP